MENANKFILIAVGLLITILLVMFGIRIFNTGSAFGTVADEKAGEAQQNLEELEFTTIDLNEYNGAFVLAKIQEYGGRGGELIVQVTTLSGNTSQYVSTGTIAATTFTVSGTVTETSDPRGDLANAKDISNAAYINPTGTFQANIGRDSNDSIRAIAFIQQ